MRALLAIALVAAAASTALADHKPRHRAPSDHLTFDPNTVYKVPRGHSPAEGPADAPVTIVDWSDYACGYCNRVQATLDRLNRLYPGQLRWVHRVLPLDDDNTIAAEAALAAAGQGKFWPMHQRLFAVSGHVDRVDVELYARELGLDMIRFRAELDTGIHRRALAEDVADARGLGVAGTPTFFINGRPVHGNQPLRVFVAMVDAELARAAQVRASHPTGELYDALVADGKLAADAPADTSNESDKLDNSKIYRIGLGIPGHQVGPDTALVTIVVWSDFQCPYCAKQAPVLAHARARFGDDVRVIYRHFPVLFHRDSLLAAEAGAAAAGQGKFWAFHDRLFGRVDATAHLARADLEQIAADVGLDLPRFRAALDDRRYHDAVIEEGAAAEALGVDGTPTLFINGHPVVGAKDEVAFDRLVDAYLAQARAVVAKGLAARDVYALLMTMAEGDDRADPSAVPVTTLAHVEPREDDRARAVAAACRRRDGARAAQLAAPLRGDARQRALVVCAGVGIDLP